MSYTDYCLRFDSAAQAELVLFEGDGDERCAKYAAVDVIGTIHTAAGLAIDGDDGALAVATPLQGWHVNVRHFEPAPELEPYRVTPASPVRVWA